MTNEERHGTSCFEFQLQTPIESEVPFNVSWGVMGPVFEAQTSCKGQFGAWRVTENRLKPLHYIKMERWTTHFSNRLIHTSYLTFPLFTSCLKISAISMQRGVRGEREWQGPLLRRVDYIMKGNQLERYGGLWTFIHLVWPLLNFHDGLWLFRGRDQT